MLCSGTAQLEVVELHCLSLTCALLAADVDC